jgi:hypothetical protein
VIAEALAALYDVAPKCDVCEEHVATRDSGPDDAVCDRADCGDHLRCVRCATADSVGALDGWLCVWCGSTLPPRREPAKRWCDREHAEVLRAANAAREALAAP